MSINIKNIYSLIICFAMILYSYSFSFEKNISIIYLLLFTMIPFIIMHFGKSKHKFNKIPLLITILILFVSLISYSFNDISFQAKNITDILKLITWGIILSFSVQLVNKQKLVKWIINISIIATVYLFIQSIFYYALNIQLPNVFNIPLLQYMTENLSSVDLYRPASFFCEPAYYATYVLCSVAILLFDNNVNIKNKKLVIIILSIGIVFSTSSAGIYMLLFLFAYNYYINGLKNFKKVLFYSIIIIPILILISYNYVSILSSMGTIGNYTLNAINKITNYSTSNRLGGSYDYIYKLSGINKLFGYGIGNEYYTFNEIRYLNSITRLFYQVGLIGFICFMLGYIIMLFNSKTNISKYIIILYLVKCLSGGAMFSISGIFLLMLYYLYNEKEVNNND